jgi:IS30 family transposase
VKYRTRIYYTEEQKALMWDRWQAGDSLHEIARLFDRHHSSVRGIFERCGGMRPPTRRRSIRSLTLTEREEISCGIDAGRSLRSIALRLGRAPSTVSRELRRNGGRHGYRASRADEAAWDRARRPKICKLARHRALARLVAARLKLQWSPEEIAGWLGRTYADDEKRQVSHETIYKTLFIQARGALKKELLAHLRLTKSMRHPRGHTQKNRQIKEAVSIRERPAEAEDRAVPGHWEGDLLIGSNNSQIATLVERHTRYCMLIRVRRRDTETVINALIKQAHKLPRELYKSLTWDRGKEIADHKRFTLDTGIQVYLCDPSSPWQRGSNEQINGLLRQYFPKAMDLSNVHQNHLNAIARRLNERPRKTLGYYSPAQKFAECVASTG